MKALLASALTALVFVTAAWASNVTPAQLSALSKRVTRLERANASLRSLTYANAAQIAKTQAALETAMTTVSCIRAGWNAQRFEPYGTYRSDAWQTSSGSLTVFAQSPAADGVAASGYLVAVPSIMDQC